MVIRINGADADIQLETEKTVGEVLYGLDSWFAGTGHRLSGLDINGEAVDPDDFETCFHRSIDTVDALDINTNSLPELFAESLLQTLQDIKTYEAADFEEKGLFAGQWKESPQAMLLTHQSPDLVNRITETFSGEGFSAQVLRLLIEERLRELYDPESELNGMQPMLDGVCIRLEELPLDIQTGKDTKAAQTITAFSGLAEKIFRIINILKLEGVPVEKITVDNMPVTAYIGEFNTALRELLTAYEQHDTVLMGDLAEYEMAPRLKGLYNALSRRM